MLAPDLDQGGASMLTFAHYAARFAIGIVLFVGLPLAGWGIMDAQSFASHPLRLGYIVVMVLLRIVAHRG
jgi:hypothetical protein